MAEAPQPNSTSQRESEIRQDHQFAPHGVLFSVISALINLLQIKYQAAEKSPFERHSEITVALHIVIVVYVLILKMGIILKAANSQYYAIIGNVNVVIGALAAVLLLLMLIPEVGWSCLAIWVPVFMCAIYCSYRELQKLRNSQESSSSSNERTGPSDRPPV